MSYKANVESDSPSFVAIIFHPTASIPYNLNVRLADNKFYKMGALGSNRYVATPDKSERELCKRIADLIAQDYNMGKYPDIIQPRVKVRHG